MSAPPRPSVVRDFFEQHSVPREVPEAWVRALSPRSSARWFPWALWCFPLIVALFGLGTVQWEGGQFVRAFRDFRQNILPSPDLRTVDATILSVERQTVRKQGTDLMRVLYQFTIADGRIQTAEGYFVEHDLPKSDRLTLRYLPNNPAITFPAGGSHGLPGLWWGMCLWVGLVVITAVARPLIHRADRAEVRRVLRLGELQGDRLELGSNLIPITLAELESVVNQPITAAVNQPEGKSN